MSDFVAVYSTLQIHVQQGASVILEPLVKIRQVLMVNKYVDKPFEE
jgi:hypothetical protein